MSATYIVNGYVDVRIKLINKNINASQSSSPSDISELVKMNIENNIGLCEIIGHKIMIEEL